MGHGRTDPHDRPLASIDILTQAPSACLKRFCTSAALTKSRSMEDGSVPAASLNNGSRIYRDRDLLQSKAHGEKVKWSAYSGPRKSYTTPNTAGPYNFFCYFCFRFFFPIFSSLFLLYTYLFISTFFGKCTDLKIVKIGIYSFAKCSDLEKYVDFKIV
jgi:hypothetical protein